MLHITTTDFGLLFTEERLTSVDSSTSNETVVFSNDLMKVELSPLKDEMADDFNVALALHLNFR